MKIMKKYIDAELQIVRVNNSDIITSSSKATLENEVYFDFYSTETVDYGI